MKYLFAILAALAILLNFALPVLGSSPEAPLPQISGESAILIDVSTGQTLYSKNPDQQLEPASTTKIMTALIALEQSNLKEIVTPGPSMANWDLVQGTRIYLEPGEQISIGNLLYALLLNSANDAAVAIAEHISGDISQFAELMNQKARQLGAWNTTFKNPSGLSEDGHLTTARDLALISRAAYQNPVFRDYVRTKKQMIPRNKADIPTEMYNVNELLWTDSTVTGIKTGYTSSAGNTFVATVSRDGRELLGVILKSPSGVIYDDMENLFAYGFSNFENLVVKPEGSKISTVMVNKIPVDLILNEQILSTQKIGSEDSSPLTLTVEPIPAELSQIYMGQFITNVQVLSDGKVLNVIPLMAGGTVTSAFSWQSIAYRLGIPLVLLVMIFWGYREASYRIRRHKRLQRRMLSKSTRNKMYN